MNATARIAIPLCLGAAAALMNLVAVRGAIAPVELAVAKSDAKVGIVLTDEMIAKISVRADRALLRSAVPYEERGAALLGRKLRRAVQAQDVLFFEDVRREGDVAQLSLKPGEVALQVSLESIRQPPGLLRIGMEAGFLLVANSTPAPSASASTGALQAFAAFGGSTAAKGAAAGDAKESVTRMVGPFRIVSIGDRTDPFEAPQGGDAGAKMVGIAVRAGANGEFDPQASDLMEAMRSGRNGKGASLAALVLFPGKAAQTP